MESGSESAAEKVPRWAMGPTEDVVQALMETLVDPLLPLRVSSVPPTEDVQIAIAKQMHAVVLLYNYHLRKQIPELVFLEFVNFCKLAIVIRPSLIAFMKMMKESKPKELNGSEDWLSVTEKAIRDACDIAVGLDASRDVPNIEGWPISKVAVLLIDLKKENCMLQFGPVTKGVWSLIEKELNDITPDISAGKKVGNKRKRDNLKESTYNTEFLQLGYDTVKDVTGINSSDLEVLETHMTYSSSKEKSTARFYIMQCPGSFNKHEQVPLKFLVESVQGPLAEKFANGLWKTTPPVNFHHMLPYRELLLCWLSGCPAKVNSSDKKSNENCYSLYECDDSSHGQVASPVDNFQSTEKDGNLTNKFVKRWDSAESTQKGIFENLADGSKRPDKGLLPSPSRGPCEMVVKVDNTMEQFEKGCYLADDATEVASRITLENSATESDVPVSGYSGRLSGKTVVDNNVREKFKEKHDVQHSAEKGERRACPDTLDEDRVECGKDILSGPPGVLKTTNMNDVTNICTDSEDKKMLKSKIRVYHHKRKKNSCVKNAEQLGEAVPDLMVEVNSLKSNHTQRSDENVSGDKGYLTNTCNQTGTASTGGQWAQLEDEIKHNVEVQNTSDSWSDHIQSRDGIVSGDNGNRRHECNQTGIAARGNQLAQVEVDSLKSNHTERSDEKVSGDEGSLTNMCNQTVTASTGDQQAQLEVKIKHNVEVQNTSDSLRSNRKRNRDEMVSGENCDCTHECNLTGSAAAGNQLVQVEVDSLKSNHTERGDEKVCEDKGYLTNTCNQTGTPSTGDQRAQLEAKIKHNVEVQKTSDCFRLNHIRSRDETISGDKGDRAHQCNQTGIAAIVNQLAQDEAKLKHDLGAQTISASDQVQNALALLYRKRRELYSQICNMEDTLALFEDNVSRIRDGGEVDLARQCIKSVISGKLHLPLENGTQVQDKGNQQEENNRKSQHGKPTRLSEAYLPGKSSCQDLEHTCVRNNWRLPRYLTESSDGKFLSNVSVEGKDFKLHAKGGFESKPCVARETAAAEMITVLHNTFL